MIFTFPDLDQLLFALTSGAVPPSVALAPAVAGRGDDGRVWVEPSVSPPRKAQDELRRLGVVAGKAPGAAPASPVSCWLELLPLRRADGDLARPEQTPVLFDLPAGEQLATFATEMLRLGNDRQGYRWLDDQKAKAGGRALLRVVGPPYYSLLRALDGDGAASAPVAFVEQAPRVWVQFGHRHPLGDKIKPPPGKIVLLRPPSRWAFLDDAPFRDLYEALDFTLPAAKTPFREGELGRKIVVPLRLARGGTSDAAELWVLRDDPVEQLDALAREADDLLLGRLAFAVGEAGGRKTVVLRTRPSRTGPPELALRAVGFRPYLKLPNLFLPVGTRLHPPLRRDAVRKRLADDPALVTWLSPEPDGTFTPESLPDDAFRPLSGWIDYVLEHDHRALTAWVEATRFEFEGFVCDDETPPARPKKSPKVRRDRPETPPPQGERPGGEDAPPAPVADTPADVAEPEAETFPVGPPPAAAPDAMEEHLRGVEERFLAADGGLDAEERRRLWPEMAELNAKLGHADDAGVCWMNALWSHERPPAPWAASWLRAEGGADVTAAALDRLLGTAEPATAEVRALAAYLFWAGCQASPPPVVVKRLGRVQPFLEAHERLVPVRASWLAWLGVTKLAGGDALALARARDRVLERLFRAGLRPEQDLPSFLRFSGPAGNQRFRAIRHWLVGLADSARRWVQRQGRPITALTSREPKTAAYADLTFAFGLARLGEADACERLRERARKELTGEGPAHEFLMRAYDYRITRLLNGAPHAGPLPDEQMQWLNGLDNERKRKGETAGTGNVYIIDRLRSISRVLEPDQTFDAYRRHKSPFEDEVRRGILELPDILDRAEAAERVRRLLKRVPKGKEGADQLALIVCGALDQAALIGEAFSDEMLGRAAEAFDALPDAGPTAFVDRAKLLEKGLSVAAHFDRQDHVQRFIARTRQLLATQRDTPGDPAFDKLADRCLFGLRKFGMHGEIDKLLRLMAEVVLRGRDVMTLDAAWGTDNAAALRTLLHVASGWFYFGHDAEAGVVLRVARDVLLAVKSQDAQGPKIRKALACAYTAPLREAPVELAQQHFEELFDKVGGIVDTFTTSDHYSQLQLEVVEAVVLAVVSDDFTVGADVRRWLDDDEYLVRRRVHQDVRRLVTH